MLRLQNSRLVAATLLVIVAGAVLIDAQAQLYPFSQTGYFFRPRSSSAESSVELGGSRVGLPVGWNRRFGKRAVYRRAAILDSLGGHDFLIR